MLSMILNLKGSSGLCITNTLFSGTIRENMLWGNENATDEEIVTALSRPKLGNLYLNTKMV